MLTKIKDTTFDFAKIQNQKLKDKINIKIQERAMLNLKAELTIRHKKTEEYSDEELEIMLENERRKIIDDLKNKTLLAVLAILGINLTI